MPIEFRCTHCHALLRTAEDTAGKQAQCPLCGTLTPIPDPNPSASAGETAPWLAPPIELGQHDLLPPDDVGQLEIGQLMTTAWRILERRMGLCIGGFLAAGFTFCAAGIALTLPLFGFLAQAGNQNAIDPTFATVGVASWWLSMQLIYCLMLTGQIVVFLKVARGQPSTLGDYFSGWRYLPHTFVVYLIANLAIALGFVLLIVPGIIVTLIYSQAMYAVVDRGATLREALADSRQLTRGHKLQLFYLLVIVCALYMAATIPCYLGLLIFYPWQGMLWAVVYLRLSGQAVADTTT